MTSQERDGGRSFSVVVAVSRLPQDGLAVRVEADAAERQAVAGRFGLVSVERFEVDLVARRWQRDGVSVAGSLSGSVVQTDVVALEPVRQEIAEDVELFFVPEHSRLAAPAAADAELDLDPAEDAPETFRGDRIELGEALTQLFGLALDPYPRGGGVEFAEVREGGKEPSPFAVLAALRDKKNG